MEQTYSLDVTHLSLFSGAHFFFPRVSGIFVNIVNSMKWGASFDFARRKSATQSPLCLSRWTRFKLIYPVSVPLSALSFSVSWPRSVYVANPADCLETLQQRIVTADVLPDGKSYGVSFVYDDMHTIGWSYVKTPDQLVYYKLHLARSDAAPQIEFSLQIESDFSRLYYL